MNTMTASLSDILKSLVQSLRVSSSFPATVFVLLNSILIIPQYTAIDLSAASTVIILTTAILVLSYLLYAFNAPLIQLAEGYPFRYERLGQRLSERQKKKFKLCLDEIAMAQKMNAKIVVEQARLVAKHKLVKPEQKARHEEYRQLEKWRQGWETRGNAARQTLYYYYPYPEGSESQILPTRLGNTLNSFERYPHDRYGILAVIMWPRLVPILQKEEFVSFVEGEKTVFDFLLNLAFLTSILALEAGFLVSLDNPVKGLLLCISFAAMAFALYKAAVVGALNWGATVQVAFDLYRGHLRKALRLREPGSLEEERTEWRNLSQFYVDGTPFDQFIYEGTTESSSTDSEDRGRTKTHRVGCWPFQRNTLGANSRALAKRRQGGRNVYNAVSERHVSQ